MTLNELTDALSKMNPAAPLVFEAASGRTGKGYHVTEFKLADIQSIDCGGRQDTWQEVTLQLQDGKGWAHMPVGKFLQIAQRSASAIDELGENTLRVEFSANNERLEILDVHPPEMSVDAVIVPLGTTRAACKPMLRQSAKSVGCCG